MCFVDYRNPKRYLADDIEVTNQGIIGGDEDVELEVFRSVWPVLIIPLILSQHITPHSLSVVVDTVYNVGPSFEFASPVLNGRQRHHDKIGSANLLDTEQVLYVANNLDGLK